MIRVYIIEDHQMMIDGLYLMLDAIKEITTIGHALDAEKGIEQIKILQPDIVLLDINLPGMNGIEACKIVMHENPKIKIIALSMHLESSMIKLMLQHGAQGYVLKSSGQEEIIKAIKTVYCGKMYLQQAVNDIVIQSIKSHEKKGVFSNPFPTLSRREKEVLALILEEYTTQEIANKLFIGFGTVETHRRNMMVKTGARNTAGLVRIALEYDLLERQ